MWLGTGSQHAELVAVGIRHDHPIDGTLADVDPGRSKRDQTIDLRLLVHMLVGGDVEMQPVLTGLGSNRSAAPGDERTRTVGGPDGCLFVLIPNQRPSKGCAPEVARPLAFPHMR